jgi:hypothetical protein
MKHTIRPLKLTLPISFSNDKQETQIINREVGSIGELFC